MPQTKTGNILAEDISFQLISSENIFQDLKKSLNELVGIFEKFKEIKTDTDEKIHFYKADDYIQKLQIWEKFLTDSQKQYIHKFVAEELVTYINVSSLAKNIYHKPRGYAGDFETMQMIWNGRLYPDKYRYQGATDLGKYINAYTLDINVCRANIERTKLFEYFLNKNRGKEIASIGSGPVLELESYLKTTGEKPNITLYDIDQGALEVGEKKLKSHHVNLICGNILKTILKTPDESFDTMYCSGLYDYFGIESCIKITESLMRKLKKGGSLMISNLNPLSQSYFWITYFGNWPIQYKTQEEIIRLISGLKNIKNGHYYIDGHGCYQYLTVTKV